MSLWFYAPERQTLKRGVGWLVTSYQIAADTIGSAARARRFPLNIIQGYHNIRFLAS
jgi:hypothetical protein